MPNGAGDEARGLGIRWMPRKEAAGPYPPPDSPPDCRIGMFEPSSPSNIKKKPHPNGWGFLFYGAGDEARTRYLHLGKVALYRMSYTREEHDLL